MIQSIIKFKVKNDNYIDTYLVESHRNGTKSIYKNDDFIGNLKSWIDVEKLIGTRVDKGEKLYTRF